MPSGDRERRSQRLFYGLILVLLLGYAGIKYEHVRVAMAAYDGQPLNTDTTGAAK
ncbi:hypothetical protein TA5114_03347 [Cognatishimia activa]|uniref:Uncharacterized protein n=1 Tax=Cognatishimia activa TaxID=1715691 RepID=A0A0P1IVM3_9RHOB|nr:hypothetical protein [Cognatishimia activa]CUK27519.1 hypothetical protein TA5114_03347 [Cognatishimia activa]